MTARSQPAFVSPTVLKWARERCGFSVAALAGRTNLKEEKLKAWEQGKALPTLRQAQHVANALHVPFGYFFLSEPPEEPMPLPDFRTIGTSTRKTPSPDLLDLLNDTIFKHSWYREFAEEETRQPLDFVGRYSSSTPPEVIAGDIRNVVGTLSAMREESTGSEDFLRRFIRRIEALGILVMKSSVVGGNAHRKLDVREFRGFTIADALAPLIFINASDARAAQIFTLGHELAHVWIGASGISNEDMAVVSAVPSIELLCNQVAAEVLVPSRDFKEAWDRRDVDTTVATLTRKFRVSSLVILRRAVDLGALTEKQFRERYLAEEQRFREQEEQQSGGGSFFATLLARNGVIFTNAVLQSLGEGRSLYREAAQLLNVKIPTLHKISEYLEAT